MLDWAGYDVQREFYVNDAGNQIEKFATSLEVRYLQHYDPAVELPEGAYKGVDIVEHAENFIKDTATGMWTRPQRSGARRWWILPCLRTLPGWSGTWRIPHSV